MKRMTLAAAIQEMLQQGPTDLTRFRSALATYTGESLEAVDAAIAQAGPARVVDAETVAQERLAAERRDAKTYRAAHRAYQHEEE